MYWDQELYVKAWDFATVAHEGQTYGGPGEGQRFPYINHIGSVAMEVMSALPSDQALDGNLAVPCALLHDVLEDTDHTYEELKTIFGARVAEGVQALTKDENLPTKQAQMEDSLERIKRQPKEVWVVKMADRITNLSEPPFYWDAGKKAAYQAEARSIYESLKLANEVIAARLQEKIENYARFLG